MHSLALDHSDDCRDLLDRPLTTTYKAEQSANSLRREIERSSVANMLGEGDGLVILQHSLQCSSNAENDPHRGTAINRHKEATLQLRLFSSSPLERIGHIQEVLALAGPRKGMG